MKLYRLLPALPPLALATGCITILHGTHQNVTVDPSGATASAAGQTITTATNRSVGPSLGAHGLRRS
jgi:hypothetical protein